MRRAVGLVVVGALVVLGVAFIGSPAGAAAPYPAYGSATVDGSAAEWNTSTSGSDFFAPMYLGADPSKPTLANGFLRYDCSAGRMYVLVLQAPGSAILLSPNDAWAMVNDNPQKAYTGTDTNPATEFAWINPNTSAGTADGYEASFPLSAGTTSLTLGVHAEADPGSGANTSAFAGTIGHNATGGIAVVIDCAANSTTTTAPPTTTSTTTPPTTVPPRADLTVTADAATSYTRDFGWAITKRSNASTFKQVGGSVTANYSVGASQTGYVDSAWHVTGTITMTNPNPGPVTGVSVAATVDNGGTCVVNGGSGDVATTRALTYDCTYASAPTSNTGAVTATATWDAAANNTVSGAATATAAVAFGDPTTVLHGTATITDSMTGLLGALTGSASAPASAAYAYPRTFGVPAFGCVANPNTATIGETGQNASATVTVCGPVKTGALTIGYWQNKNGQAIITGGASTNGVCNSATYLNAFNPFKDLGAVSCAKVGTYVTNVIKAANASGAAMNAMLKAQMLATALDVYFGGGDGGNKIGSPVNVGTVSIDLTKVCTSPSSCASYEDESSAFGAPALTISQALAAAAGQSNAGGVTWFGNVKGTQQLAKDFFDAVNNEVAFRS